MELISRDEAIKALEEVTCDVCEHRSTWCALCDKAEVLTRIHSLPTIEELVTVEYKQNECLYLETDEDTLLETECIVMSTDGMYKQYVHETE